MVSGGQETETSVVRDGQYRCVRTSGNDGEEKRVVELSGRLREDVFRTATFGLLPSEKIHGVVVKERTSREFPKVQDPLDQRTTK